MATLASTVCLKGHKLFSVAVHTHVYFYTVFTSIKQYKVWGEGGAFLDILRFNLCKFTDLIYYDILYNVRSYVTSLFLTAGNKYSQYTVAKT